MSWPFVFEEQVTHFEPRKAGLVRMTSDHPGFSQAYPVGPRLPSCPSEVPAPQLGFSPMLLPRMDKDVPHSLPQADAAPLRRAQPSLTSKTADGAQPAARAR